MTLPRYCDRRDPDGVGDLPYSFLRVLDPTASASQSTSQPRCPRIRLCKRWPAATVMVAGSRVSKGRLGLLASPSREFSGRIDKVKMEKRATHTRLRSQSTVATRIFYRVAPGNIPCHYQTSLTCTDNHCRRELLVCGVTSHVLRTAPSLASRRTLNKPCDGGGAFPHTGGTPCHGVSCLLMLTCAYFVPPLVLTINSSRPTRSRTRASSTQGSR